METLPNATTDTKPTARWSGLATRIFGILPLLLIAAMCIISGGWLFYVFVMTCAIIMLKEWDALTKDQSRLLKILGYPLVIIPCASIVWLNALTSATNDNFGFQLVLALIVIVAATDIGAYFTGKRLGKHKLAPTISPNKTWEGLSGGVFCAMLASVIVIPFSLPIFSMLGIGLMLALLAQTGDLLESWIKRKAGVKDSGSLIPGHGGLLDRFDGYLLSAPVFALLVYGNI